MFAETRGSGTQYFTFKIYEKYRGALADRPITLNATFRTPEQADQNAMRDFIDYGAPLELGQNLTTIDADLPGGLAGTLTGAIRILPLGSLSDSQSRTMRMRIVDAADGSAHEVKLHVQPATAGLDGRNLRGMADDEGGAFSVELRYKDDDSSQTFQFIPHDLSGKVANRVASGLHFLSKLRSGNTFEIAQEFGPYTGEPQPIPRDLTALVDDKVLELIDSIVVLQTLTSNQLTVPDLSTLTLQQGEEIVVAAKVSLGEEVVVHFNKLEFTPNGSPVPEGENAMFITQDLDVKVGELSISVGPIGFHFERVKIELEADAENPDGIIVARPIDTPKMKAVARLLPATAE